VKDLEIKKIAEFFEKSISDFIEKKQEINSTSDKNYKLKQLILYISKKTQNIDSF
jgi:hypothetical protein